MDTSQICKLFDSLVNHGHRKVQHQYPKVRFWRNTAFSSPNTKQVTRHINDKRDTRRRPNLTKATFFTFSCFLLPLHAGTLALRCCTQCD